MESSGLKIEALRRFDEDGFLGIGLKTPVFAPIHAQAYSASSTPLRRQLVSSLTGADITDGHAHVRKLLPRSVGLATALALGRHSVACTDFFYVLPAR